MEGYLARILLDFLERLDQAQTFDDCFAAFSEATQDLGFEGAVYTFIPSPLLQQNIAIQPVFKVSGSFCPKFLQHYAEAEFEQQDFTIKHILKGDLTPMDWWTTAETGTLTPSELEVIETAKVCYGLKNGISIPTLSSRAGIAGASFINRDRDAIYKKLLAEELTTLRVITQAFSDRVVANPRYSACFALPFFQRLSANERTVLRHLNSGLPFQKIEDFTGIKESYARNIMVHIRNKYGHIPTKHLIRLVARLDIYDVL